MLTNLVELIQEYRVIVLVATLPFLFIYGRVLFRALFAVPGGATKTATAPIRRVPPRPVAPTPPPVVAGKQEVLPSASGISSNPPRGAAKTVKIPVAPAKATDGSAPTDLMPLPRVEAAKSSTAPAAAPVDADVAALEGLFGGVKSDIPPGESKTGAIRRKATRMEELGFHHGIQSDAPVSGEAPGTTSTKPGELPRSQTAELTSILERIDKFLAEDQPAATAAADKPATPAAVSADASSTTAVIKTPVAATPAPAATAPNPVPASETPGGKPDPTKKTQPLWARTDALDEDVDHAAKPPLDKSADKLNDKPADQANDSGQQRLF